MIFIILFLSIHLCVFAGPDLEYLLNIDRFQTYIQSWSQTMKGRGKTELAKALDGLTPQKIFGLKMDPKKLEDAFRYDELILEYLNQKHPTLKATSEEVHWGYDFYKRKLNESFKLGDAKSFKPTQSPVVEIGTPRGKEIIPPPLESSEVLLNVDGYVASRTTRGVFWEASLNQRPIELHIGTAADFKETLALRGGKILGEVKTQARNYNPIYLIQYPESKTFHYAITEISGEDRVRHLTLQSSMVRWEGGKGKGRGLIPSRLPDTETVLI